MDYHGESRRRRSPLASEPQPLPTPAADSATVRVALPEQVQQQQQQQPRHQIQRTASVVEWLANAVNPENTDATRSRRLGFVANRYGIVEPPSHAAATSTHSTVTAVTTPAVGALESPFYVSTDPRGGVATTTTPTGGAATTATPSRSGAVQLRFGPQRPAGFIRERRDSAISMVFNSILNLVGQGGQQQRPTSGMPDLASFDVNTAVTPLPVIPQHAALVAQPSFNFMEMKMDEAQDPERERGRRTRQLIRALQEDDAADDQEARQPAERALRGSFKRTRFREQGRSRIVDDTGAEAVEMVSLGLRARSSEEEGDGGETDATRKRLSPSVADERLAQELFFDDSDYEQQLSAQTADARDRIRAEQRQRDEEPLAEEGEEEESIQDEVFNPPDEPTRPSQFDDARPVPHHIIEPPRPPSRGVDWTRIPGSAGMVVRPTDMKMPSQVAPPPPPPPPPQTMADQILKGVENKLRKKGAMRKRRLGEGVLGRFCGRKRRTDLSEKTKWMIWKAEAADQFRPYFTWWITFVQIAVCLASLLLYGMAPNVSQGLSRVERQKNVLHSSLTYKVVAYWEPTNVWLGPRFADLILLGAKYTPCMRTDRKIEQLIERERREENKTGCCIYNDGAGCFQSSWQACPSLLAAHIKWPSSSPASGGRSAGAVCGQDPAFCQDLVDVRTGERKSDWPDDLTRWPICQKPRQPNETMSVMVATSVYPHMTCDSTAVRPCCIQLQGQCRMATREYCDFVRGHFHEEARLCSQVSCMEDVCGLTGFFLVGKPDQIIRLVTSLFLHAGLVHVALSAFLQYWLMADLEKMIGVGRMATLYLVSGTLANLASTIFVPYNPEVGPIGSQMSLVAALFLDVIYYRSVIVAPHKEVFKLLLVVILALFAGTVPWIDNWASAFGLIYGFPLAIVLIPRHPIGDDDEEEEEGGGGGADYDDDKVARAHEDREKRRRLKRLKVVVVCMAFIGFLTAVLVLLFIRGTLDCAWCVNVNCHDWPARVYAAILNFTKDETQDERLHFCDNKGQRLVSLLPI